MARASPGPAHLAATEAGRGRWRKAPAGVCRSATGTLVHLRHGVTHDVLARWFGVDRSTITRPSARCGPCSPSEAARPAPTCG
ncbi:transposase family protein [Streptomyces sp. NPDC047967]|uniref:helix-turn-helix domain-containing protein n=1 Tax=unclassified Streptomyces TaxID=2593676 RepID=UPI0033CF3F9B